MFCLVVTSAVVRIHYGVTLTVNAQVHRSAAVMFGTVFTASPIKVRKAFILFMVAKYKLPILHLLFLMSKNAQISRKQF